MAKHPEPLPAPFAGPGLPSGAILHERYVVLQSLTTTQLSSVVLGYDLAADCVVTLKHLHTPGTHAADHAALLFVCEAWALQRLRHPQIPRLLAAFRTRGGYVLVLPHLAGERLDHLLTQPQLSASTRLALARSLCAVVAYLHAQTPALIHADIKPENMIVMRDGNVVLIDFGLARAGGQALSGPAMGTPGYAPPEQWRGEALDERADVYALGQVLRELLAGMHLPAELGSLLASAAEPERAQRRVSAGMLLAALPHTTARQSSTDLRKSVSGCSTVGRSAEGCRLPTADRRLPTATGNKLQPGHTSRCRWSSAPALVSLVLVLTLTWAFLNTANGRLQQGKWLATSTPALRVRHTPSQPHSPLPTSLPDDSAAAAVREYQQARADAIAGQDLAPLAGRAAAEALAHTQSIIAVQRALGARMQISVAALHILDVQRIDEQSVAVLAEKTEDRLLFPAGCTVPDDQWPCRAAHPVSVRAEHYHVRYLLARRHDHWVVVAARANPE